MTAHVNMFEDLQADMYFALGGVSLLKVATQANAIFGVIRSSLSISRRLRGFVKKLTIVDWESLPEDMVLDLVKLYESLLEAFSLMRIHEERNLIYRFLFREMEKNTGDLGDILENLYLSKNKDFKDLLEGAVKGIKEGERHPDWRSSLAKM